MLCADKSPSQESALMRLYSGPSSSEGILAVSNQTTGRMAFVCYDDGKFSIKEVRFVNPFYVRNNRHAHI